MDSDKVAPPNAIRQGASQNSSPLIFNFRHVSVPFIRAVLTALMVVAFMSTPVHCTFSVVVPALQAGSDGRTDTDSPFNVGAGTARFQQVYAGSEFGAVPAGGAWITALRFRRDVRQGPFSGTLPAMQISLSTVRKVPDRLGTSFAANVGTDEKVVFSGPLTLRSDTKLGSLEFDVLIPLSTAFLYDPASGNLLMDVRNSGGGFSGSLDAVNATADAVSRVLGAIDARTGSADTLGLVTSFLFAVPGEIPVILDPPRNVSASWGETVTFAVGAAGLPKVTYQWRRNGEPIPDVVGEPCCRDTLTLSDVDPSRGGFFDVIVGNPFGSVTSSVVSLTLVEPSQPPLMAVRGGHGLEVSWPETRSPVLLQETPQLGTGESWRPVATPVRTLTGRQRVDVSADDAFRFFQLGGVEPLQISKPGKWTEEGPNLAGRLSAIVARPSDVNTLLVSSPGGGVWRTTNGGGNWVRTGGQGLADFSVMHLEWDRIRNGRLFASTHSDLYASADLGEHWTNLTHFGGYPAAKFPESKVTLVIPVNPRPFAQMRLSPTTSVVLWSKPGLGLYYSYDGVSFVQHWPFPGGTKNADNFLLSIGTDEKTGYVYFSTLRRESGLPARLHRSSCAWTAAAPCLSWVDVSAGLPSAWDVAAIVSGGSPNVLAIALDTPNTTIYTTVTGTNWTSVPTQISDPAWDPRVLLSPFPNQLILGSVVGYQSTDWGSHWNSFNYLGMHPDIRGAYWGDGFLWTVMDGTQSSGNYAAISRFKFTPGKAPSEGVTIGTAGIGNWQPYFYTVTGKPGLARRRRFIGAQDDGCLCRDDNAAWTTQGIPGVSCGDFISMVVAPSDPNRAYARTCDGPVFSRSDNLFSAATCHDVVWTNLTTAVPNQPPDLWTDAIISIDPGNPDHVCFANQNDIAVSKTGGKTWTHRELPAAAGPICVFVNADKDLLVGTLGEGLFRSTDDGATWVPFGLNGNPPRAVLKIAHSPSGGADGTWFAATTEGLFRKRPGGAFTRQTPDAGYTVTDVEVDRDHPDRIGIGFGFAAILGQHRGGVALSVDGGDTFVSLTAGLAIHQCPIADLQFDPVDSRIIHAAVHGLGAWSYTDP